MDWFSSAINSIARNNKPPKQQTTIGVATAVSAVATSDSEVKSARPSLRVNKGNYLPGEEVLIRARGFGWGQRITFELKDARRDPGDDGDVDVYAPFRVRDGGRRDLDGERNGRVVARWRLPSDDDGSGGGTPDALNGTLKLKASGRDGRIARVSFTDALPSDATLDLTSSGNTGAIGAARFSNVSYSAGTGVIDPFVRIQANGSEQGYNSSSTGSAPDPQFNETGKYASTYNHALPLNAIPLAYLYNPDSKQLEAYRQFLLDINEASTADKTGQQFLSLDALQIYQSNSNGLYAFTGSPTEPGTFSGGTSMLRYDLDGGSPGGGNWAALNFDLNPGSGYGDIAVYIPDSLFDDANDNPYVYVYSAFGNQTASSGYAWESSDGFEEWSIGLGAPRSVSELRGSKFIDANHNGIKESGEPDWPTHLGEPLQQNGSQGIGWAGSHESLGLRNRTKSSWHPVPSCMLS